MTAIAQRIDELVSAGWNLNTGTDYASWTKRVGAFLATALGPDSAQAFAQLGTSSNLEYFWNDYRDSQIGHLEGLALRLETVGLATTVTPGDAIHAPRPVLRATKRVFVVHGHDVGAKESTARFLEKLELEPVILHEKANEGRTVIEKFEAYADVGFAVVLLTPDDVGASVANTAQLNQRARQNVVLELGYFAGKLGRSRVCGLFRKGVEIPSDFHGVLFIELDDGGAWKAKLAQELVQAGMKINLQGLLQ